MDIGEQDERYKIVTAPEREAQPTEKPDTLPDPVPDKPVEVPA